MDMNDAVQAAVDELLAAWLAVQRDNPLIAHQVRLTSKRKGIYHDLPRSLDALRSAYEAEQREAAAIDNLPAQLAEWGWAVQPSGRREGLWASNEDGSRTRSAPTPAALLAAVREAEA